jgi:crotonobetainyl-CoA:carnitine CoA-transferase CaiB-like acyl-CoA transferase
MAVLQGLRVLAVEQYGAGPFGTQALADLGAEVIKVENPRDGGDVSRHLGPYFARDLPASAQSLFFQAINRNKRSIALDLGDPAGQEVFRALVKTADAVAGNLRGDVPGRLGLTYEALGAVKPEIVCCHLSAYGTDSSRARWPGYDYLIQAETGYFTINGDPEGAPSRFGLSIVDFMTGYCLALAVVSGVLEARRTGKGREIDVSLFDVGIANLNYLATWAMNAGYEPGRAPRSGHPSLAPCQLFTTADGWIFIMANKEKFWPALCEGLGAPELASDARFRTFADRLAHREALTEVCDALFRKRSTADWMAILAGSVPCAPILSVWEALRSDFAEERGSIVALTSGEAEPVKVVGSPFRTGEATPTRAAPALGSDTRDLLAEAGYSPSEVEKLRERGVVA